MPGFFHSGKLVFESELSMKAPILQVEILIKECIDARWTEWFAGFDLAAEPDGSTRLSGNVVDQAALHGVLELIRDFNMNLVSIQVTELTKKG
jgi:hypothetical protein